MAIRKDRGYCAEDQGQRHNWRRPSDELYPATMRVVAYVR